MTRQEHRTTRFAVRARNIAAASLALCAALTATACSSSGDDGNDPGLPTSAAPSPTNTVSAEEAQARKAVIAAYQGMADEQVKAYTKGSLSGSKITDYATGKALRDVKDAVFVNLQNGIVSKGEPKVIASENDVELNLDSTPKKATLRLCFDQNTWTPIDKKTGKSVAPPNQVKRYTINANLENQGDRWRVTDEKADKERTC
ncbi:hypothetical protein OG426_55220 (plasmid) [Streptomyces canus]|uniref:hypothetical protein n=1 Tax=Streptomyces canus TaxID=58343 RepID=UPI002F91B0FB|nr:hypothetical protein OG426_55220 [Streptomyces canus]